MSTWDKQERLWPFEKQEIGTENSPTKHELLSKSTDSIKIHSPEQRKCNKIHLFLLGFQTGRQKYLRKSMSRFCVLCGFRDRLALHWRSESIRPNKQHDSYPSYSSGTPNRNTAKSIMTNISTIKMTRQPKVILLKMS